MFCLLFINGCGPTHPYSSQTNRETLECPICKLLGHPSIYFAGGHRYECYRCGRVCYRPKIFDYMVIADYSFKDQPISPK